MIANDSWKKQFHALKVAINNSHNLRLEEQHYGNINIEHSEEDLILSYTDDSFVDIEDEDSIDAEPENIEEHASLTECRIEDTVNDYEQCGILTAIITIVQRLADHASSLLFDVDTNPAETYNSIVAKFVGGKRINFSLKNSYKLRCEMAAISYNSEGKLLFLLHEELCGRSPGLYMSKFLNRQTSRREKNSKKCE
ncbi:hypothetical protein RN001_007899 [Aquatica leii]|uniref:Uncharacterized protein n=1 Tax=Aquatica leii TaxID=1421715 RepID=A0AAN7QIN5_9COLE|nr:hypothetical protein RN001_007899 [Aquatica leii]